MNTKKIVRLNFRNSVFKRDNYLCRICNLKFDEQNLDAHHIHPRKDMPNGGYVKENGITLCKGCHIKAEDKEFSEEELYNLINSNYKLAMKISYEQH